MKEKRFHINYSDSFKGILKKRSIYLFTIETNISTPFVAQELTILKKALHDERAERIRIQATEMEKVLKNLAPIHVPQPKDNRINELERDLMKVKHVRMRTSIKLQFSI